MKKHLLILPLIALGLVSCDQKQSQILGLREEFQRQSLAKDKTIDELNRKIVDLSEKNGQLQQQLLKISQESASPEKFADAVAQRVEQQNADLKARLEEIKQTLASGVPVSGGTQRGPTGGTQVGGGGGNGPIGTGTTENSSTPGRKKYKFDF